MRWTLSRGTISTSLTGLRDFSWVSLTLWGVWFSTQRRIWVSEAENLVKEIMLENGLDSDDFVNKYGRNTLVIYMTKERVPPEVAMNI
jgi:hypothetical protein